MSALHRVAPSLNQLTDTHLVRLAQAGEHAAFEELVRRHSGRVYSLAMGLMRNPTDAADVMQDAFLNAYRKIDSFRGDAAFSSWLYRIAHNSCLMKLRSRRRRPEVPLDLRPADDADGPIERPVEAKGPLVDEAFENKELGEHIRSAVAALPDSYREVFLLADVQHLSMKEIADTLDLTVPNVKTRLHRARLRLRDVLSPYLEAAPVSRAA